MERSRDMHAPFMRNCCLRARTLDGTYSHSFYCSFLIVGFNSVLGTAYSPSLIKYASPVPFPLQLTINISYSLAPSSARWQSG
jgi:hypothetical protein